MLRAVSKEMTPYVIWTLERDRIPFTYKQIEGEEPYTEFRTCISSRRFSNVVEDAICERERRESPTPEIPILSYRAAANPTRMRKLLEYYRADCFVVRETEQSKYYYRMRAI